MTAPKSLDERAPSASSASVALSGVETMRERPILFSGEMVRAILAGRKTQTRRVVKPQPSGDALRIFEHAYDWLFADSLEAWGLTAGDHGFEETGIRQPYGQRRYEPPASVETMPGDRLWVRETWAAWATVGAGDQLRIKYAADNSERTVYLPGVEWTLPKSVQRGGNAPSIFMPRWASRITLEITNVRAERVQAITSDDARAEGMIPGERASETDAYHNLWDSLNAKRGYSWESNPWVWVIEFRAMPDKPSETASCGTTRTPSSPPVAPPRADHEDTR